ncbi:hypothetical protein CNYM01_11452 [Colletotrichum nymphaeae SA-01]|uniref:Uncharacterized protein n=1 Tax=Colletotrichum nymphaeae SA-01 TaxID=1460502 RepID=A0A135SXH1_9PEZI|nr:hypothetical protein CNYM01_11452 [Colletotrichum nymphaeae SA-01]
MVNSGGETNDGGGFGGRCVFPHKGEAGTARMELEPGGPLPTSPVSSRWSLRGRGAHRCCPLVWALLGTPSLPVGVARQWPAPHWRRTRTELQKYPANYLTPSRSRLLCAASSEQPEPNLHQAPPGPWSVISRILLRLSQPGDNEGACRLALEKKNS